MKLFNPWVNVVKLLNKVKIFQIINFGNIIISDNIKNDVISIVMLPERIHLQIIVHL